MIEWQGYEPESDEAHEAAANYTPPDWANSTSDATAEQIAATAAQTQGAQSAVFDWLDSATERVSEWVADAWDTVVSWVAEKWDGLKDKFSEVYDGAKRWTLETVEAVQHYFNETYDSLFEFEQAWTADSERVVQEAVDYYEVEWDSRMDLLNSKLDEAGSTIINYFGRKLGDIDVTIDFGFEWLEARVEDLLAIPAQVFFKLLVNFFFEEVD